MNPKQLPAFHGWLWIKQGYALFMRAPLLWMVLVAIAFMGIVGLSSFPVVGEPLAGLMMPVILAGLMSGARALQSGEELELAHLFSGFQKATSQLVTLGGMALVGQYLVLGIMLAVGGGALVHLMTNPEPVTDPDVIAQAMTGASFAVLMGLLFFSLLMMAMQYAPLLVYFRGIAPFAALKLSLRVFHNNIGAMLIYSVTFLMLAVLATLPMMLGWLVLLPLTLTSAYMSFCDIFPEEAAVSEMPTRI